MATHTPTCAPQTAFGIGSIPNRWESHLCEYARHDVGRSVHVTLQKRPQRSTVRALHLWCARGNVPDGCSDTTNRSNVFVNNVIRSTNIWAVLGIEPRTSRTRSENHTTRPNSQMNARQLMLSKCLIGSSIPNSVYMLNLIGRSWA